MGQRLASLGFCLFLLAGAQGSTPALNRENQPPPATIKISTVVVNVYAIVEDRKGRLVSNLHKEDFIVIEDNAPQDTRYFSSETDAPLTLGIVVDTSLSQGSVLGMEQEEAKTLIEQVLGPKDLAFVLHFDLRVELLQNLTGDKRLLARAIDGIVIGSHASLKAMPMPMPTTQAEANVGGSHLYDAVYLASTQLMKKQVGRKVLVLMTDGEDLGSQVKPEAALEAAERANVIIYSVAISDHAFYLDRGMGFHGDSVLKKLSTATGGRMSRERDARSTAAAFRQISGELRGQYLLGYTPKKQRDGSFRKISVEMRRGNCRVRARRGYYADPE